MNNYKILMSGEYNVFDEGWNGAGVYMCSGLYTSEAFKYPIYIGSSIDVQYRIECQHIPLLNSNRHYNSIWQKSWNKHNQKDGYVWWLLESTPPIIQDAKTCEQKYFDLYKPFSNEFGGLNIAETAMGGRGPLSLEEKKHLSELYTEERRETQSLKMTGENNPMYGKTHSKEAKEKISQVHKGKIIPEELKQKWSEMRRGEGHWNFGGHHSESSRKKMSDSHPKKIVAQINKNTNEIIKIWPSITEACKNLNIKDMSGVSKVCLKTPISNGHIIKTSGGYIWRHATKEELAEFQKLHPELY